ncbi:somatostatin receptor type 2-like isoform X2 [Clavelina lepadiformis]|uniref:somatostatin receptor type 2-like isoform X2 n=1 Tax=Clavelina lepadiformis TaxID=159417 RepID=UPI0040419B3A
MMSGYGSLDYSDNLWLAGIPTDYCTPKSKWMPATKIVIAIIGLCLNIIAISVIIILKDFKKKISHWFVLQLAIADSIFLALLPFLAVEDLKGKWNFSSTMCKAFHGIFMLNYYAGIFFLTVMSFDRYIAIVHGVSARWNRIRTHTNAVIITVIVWFISAALSVPAWRWSNVTTCTCQYLFQEEHPKNYTESEDYYYPYNLEQPPPEVIHEAILAGGHAACKHKPYDNLKLWVLINFVVAFALPVAILLICYSLILWRVLHPAVRQVKRESYRRKSLDVSSRGKSRWSSISSSSSRFSSNGLRQKYRVTGIVVSLVIFFILCWLPYYVEMLWRFDGLPFADGEKCKRIHQITVLLAYSNSMLNPIFYTFLGSKFKYRLRAATRSFRQWSSHNTAFSHAPSGRSANRRREKKLSVAVDQAKHSTAAGNGVTQQQVVCKVNSVELRDKVRLLSTTLADSDCNENAHWPAVGFVEMRNML